MIDKKMILVKYSAKLDENNVPYIVKRKMNEIEKVGYTLWGYNGVFCDPINQVQPFCKNEKMKIYLVRTNSKYDDVQTGVKSTQYTRNRDTWVQVPEGINVYNSSRAFIIEKFENVDIDLDIGQYEVAIGPSTGIPAIRYLQGRTDKVCLRPTVENRPLSKILHVSYVATLREPYAVYVKPTKQEQERAIQAAY